jgi:putative molybdopterin biosynthesis protein
VADHRGDLTDRRPDLQRVRHLRLQGQAGPRVHPASGHGDALGMPGTARRQACEDRACDHEALVAHRARKTPMSSPPKPLVHLQYSFGPAAADGPAGQQGAALRNPLFDLLNALHEQGSIQQAARASGLSYRHFWGALKHWQAVLGEPLVSWSQGQPARLTPFASRLLWAETQARVRLAPHIEALRVELARALVEAQQGTQEVLTVFASHDLALPRLRELADAGTGLHLDLRFAGSVDALHALAAGRCVVAGFHVPVGAAAGTLFARKLKPLLKPGRHKLIGCTRRTQGLMLAAGNPLGLHSMADVAAAVARGARFVPRQRGSGTRLLLDHLCEVQGLDAAAIAGTARDEDSHLAVAAAVAGGKADAGLGIEAAAREFGLHFVPLVEEDYFLVCLRSALDQPALRQLCAVLQGLDWRAAVAALPGYAAPHSGQVLALTRALPWWRFRPKKPA